MKRIYTFVALAAISTLVTLNCHAAGPDMKFINEAASIVWGKSSPRFNPKTELRDSIFRDCSAVYIAVENIMDAKRNEAPPLGSQVTGSEFIGETTFDSYSRRMVLLNNAKAIESFSEFEFDEKIEQKQMGYTLYSRREAFGARIYKPDGRTIDVDVSKALPTTAGKKNETIKYKIAIPELEPGDVLDFFTFTRVYMLGNQKVGREIDILSQYPVANYKFEANVDKILTTEINTFNGLDKNMLKIQYGKNRDAVTLELENVERLDNPRYYNAHRQIPFLRFSVADNYSRLFQSLESARRPGLYINLTAPTIMAEIAERFAKRELPPKDVSKAWDIVKDYRKAHPDATWQELADAAWIACRYVALESKETYNQWDITSLFKDVVDKCKLELPVRLGASCPRSEIPIDEIAGYDQATPMVVIGDRAYYFDNNLVYMPGEISGPYQGERALLLDGSRQNVYSSALNATLMADTLADSRYSSNTELIKVNASIDTEADDKVMINYTNIMTGARKSVGSAFLNASDIVELSEEYLGIDQKKRSKRQFDKLAAGDARRTALEAMPQLDFGLENMSVDEVSIKQPGFLPGNATFEYEIGGSVDGLVTRAGNDLLLKIGDLVGAALYPKIERGSERDIDIVTSGPYNLRYNLTINVPQGYTVDTSSLQPLQVNKVNPCGLYFVQTTYDQQTETVEVVTIFRNKYRNYPMALWNEFLDLRDAAVAFADATIVFTQITQ